MVGAGILVVKHVVVSHVEVVSQVLKIVVPPWVPMGVEHGLNVVLVTVCVTVVTVPSGCDPPPELEVVDVGWTAVVCCQVEGLPPPPLPPPPPPVGRRVWVG